MATPRSDLAYGYWRDASDKFDYFVVGITGALVAYLGQNVTAARIAWNVPTVELLSILVLLVSVVLGLKRIEASIELFRLMHIRLYSEEARGSMTNVGLHGAGINVSTGDVFSPTQLLELAQLHGKRAQEVRPALEKVANDSYRYYKWRNRTLLLGFGLVLVARVLPAYTS